MVLNNILTLFTADSGHTPSNIPSDKFVRAFLFGVKVIHKVGKGLTYLTKLI